jgi:hypothetical protein
MTAATDRREALGRALAMLAEVFGESLTPARLAVYDQALDDLAAPDIKTACDRALRECKYFPRPAELRELVGAGGPSAGLVNALISRHIGTRGGDRLAPADPFLRLVLERLGGIRAASDMSMADRLKLLSGILPACVTAATVRGIPVPTEALPPAPADAPALPPPGRSLALVRPR